MKYQLILILYLLTVNVHAQTVIVHTLDQRPVLDGLAAEWETIPETLITVHPNHSSYIGETKHVILKAGVFEQDVFFYLAWKDSTESLVHKAWEWDDVKQRYVMGNEREDRLAMQFGMAGDYSTDWANANDFKADMWHWKASRSNPLGIAHDKMTVLSQNKLLRAAALPSKEGDKRYVMRKSDKGEPLYRTMRYGHKYEQTMPKYYLLTPTGSIADIKAKGLWHEGQWHLEMSRRLNTGHEDDVLFTLGMQYKGGIAVFNHSDNHSHLISNTLEFKF